MVLAYPCVFLLLYGSKTWTLATVQVKEIMRPSYQPLQSSHKLEMGDYQTTFLGSL